MESVFEKLPNTDSLYLKNSECKCDGRFSDAGDTVDFLALYRVDEITFEDKAPRKEALENVISSMSLPGINFVYIIRGDQQGVNFYYGVAKDFSSDEEKLMEINDIGPCILKPSLQGNFRGSKITGLGADEKKELLKKIGELKKTKVLEGVPGINKDDESFQSVDRIIDVMLGNEFALVLIAKPMSQQEIFDTQERMYQLYNAINPAVRSSVQQSSGKSEGSSSSETKGDSTTKGTTQSTSDQNSEGRSSSSATGSSSGKSQSTTRNSDNRSGQEGSSSGHSTSKTTGTSTNRSKSETKGTSSSLTTNTSETSSKQEGSNVGTAITSEIVNKKLQEWVKYIEDVILSRLDYGRGKGLFISTAVLMGSTEADLIKLENTIRSVYGGEAGNRMPLKAFELDENEASYVKKFQIPVLKFSSALNDEEMSVRTACSQIVKNNDGLVLGSWMSSKELSLFAGLPQKEVVGLALREEVEFGLNVAGKVEDPLLLGHLVQSGVELNGKNGTPKIEVQFEKEYFDRHIFVTGVTGSGKTTTCQKLLLESGENFMVIEPAKTEYRVLSSKYQDLLVFTLGKETAAPFRLNPFEFFPGENITSRVDMIKASMEAAFDMEAAIPQILETAIYQCYKNKGWDISTNKNRRYTDPFAGNVHAFPTLSDLEKMIEEVVKEQGFDERLKNDYIGSIRARLKGLTVGAKGLMLDTPRSLNFVELLDKKVVLELENIKSASEKSLIMGFILANLSEAIKMKYNEQQKQIKHITLIEEAHRLLSKYMPGDSLNKKQGVEMFSDMLAEVRKYGESLIIADQIPNKLTPEVLKNTNTKIVHKIFAQDDKEAIGNTMALKEEQKEHLSYLGTGCAIMMNPGLSKAIQIRILQTEDNNTERVPSKDVELRKRILEYYCSTYKQGVIPGLELLEKKPNEELLELYLQAFQPGSRFLGLYIKCAFKHIVEEEFVAGLKEIEKKFSMEDIASIVRDICYSENRRQQIPDLGNKISDLLEKIADQGTRIEVKSLDYIDMIECVKDELKNKI